MFYHNGHQHETVIEARQCEYVEQAEIEQAREAVQTVEYDYQEGSEHTWVEDPRPVEQLLAESTPQPSHLLSHLEGSADITGVYYHSNEWFKVQVSRSSKKAYAKVWNAGTWQYAGRAPLHRITDTDKVDAEQAKDFGDTYHVCIFCGTELTDTAEGSSLTGYGPICASKRGLPWTRNGEHADWKGEE